MLIYDFDTDDRLELINDKYNEYILVKNSLSEFRAQYRKFAESVSIDHHVLVNCIEKSEFDLLISIYAYSEQLIKNFYYHVLEYDSSNNSYHNKYLSSKLNPEKFSPNAKYQEIEKAISSELVKGFKFVICNNRLEIHSYDELIKSRHTYAHRGRFDFSNDYNDVIKVLRFITKEIEMVVEYGIDYRLEYQTDTQRIIDCVFDAAKLISNYKKNSNTKLKKKILDRAKELRELLRIYLKNYDTSIKEYSMIANSYRLMIAYVLVDLRKSDDVMKQIDDLSISIKIEFGK